jgi:homotetrameric cytidine deaminase
MPHDSSVIEELLVAAHGALDCAYAPYSGFRVGAAILLDDGRVFTGANVENASYGLTNCAERSAIFRAVAESPATKIGIRAIVVDNAAGVHCSPCGACRQVMAEFSRPETSVSYRGATGIVTFTMRELLPDGFLLPPA